MKTSSMARNRKIADTTVHVILGIMSVIWIFPILWIALTAFRTGTRPATTPKEAFLYFFPKHLTLDNFHRLFTDSMFPFPRWFWNTLWVAVLTCILSTIFVLCISYSFSRLRFKSRKTFMNIGLILGMFPGFMSMIAVYNVLKVAGLDGNLFALVLVYSFGQCMQYHVAKGFFDTIPKAVDEAAWIDGATKWQVFTKITIPLSKPILIYTVMTAFMAPWVDFIFAKFIIGADNYKNYTVAAGLWQMVSERYINDYFTTFAAGAVIISIPISLIFIYMQKYYVEGLSAGAVKG